MSIFRGASRAAAGVAIGAMAFAALPAGIALADPADACAAAPAEVKFSDVEEGDLFATEIECVAGYRIVGGYPDGSFQPLNDVTRGQAARFLVGFVETAMGSALPLPEGNANPFDDVPEDGTFRDDILKLYEAGIIDGVSSNEFNPLGTLTRGQMAKVVVLGLEHVGLVLDGSDAGFTDVPSGGTFKPFIDKLANEGIVGGYEDGTYKPNRKIVRRQLAAFVASGAGFADDRNEWDPTRLVGPVLGTGTATVQAGGEIEVTVTVYDEDANPVAGTPVDAFAVVANDPFDEDGQPNYAPDVSINGGGNSTGSTDPAGLQPGQGEIDGNDPESDANGRLTLTVSSDTAQQVLLIAWRGEQGSTFDNDDVASDDRGSLPLTFTEPPAAIGLTGNRETGVYPYGENARITAQLLDDGGDTVAQSGATLRYTVTRGGGTLTSGTVVAEGTVTTDAGGRATFTSPAPSDPDADADDETTDTIEIFYDQNGDNEQQSGETVEGELEITYDDTPADEVDSANIEHVTSNNPYDAARNSSLLRSDHTVEVEVKNVYGDGIPGVAVRFDFADDADDRQITTNSSGIARVTYDGPAAAVAETVNAIVDGNGDGDTQDTGSALSPGPDFSPGTLTQYWVVNATRSSHDTTNGGDGRAIAGVGTDSRIVDVVGDLRRFGYDADDTFFVDGTEVSITAFGQALASASSGDRLVVDFEPAASSTFELTNG